MNLTNYKEKAITLDMVNTEFYNTPEGIIMVKKQGSPVREFTINDREIIQEILSVIRECYPKAFSRLSGLYTKNERNRLLFEFNIVNRFIRCNFGEYDQQAYDIDYQGRFCFEEVHCPLRGECLHEGVICKPELNTKLTEREKEIVKFIADGLQAQDIADELYISVATVNRHRENIKAKLRLRNIGEIVSYYHNNLKNQ